MSRNSDRRKIKDVQNIIGAHALEKIVALQTVSFRNIDEDPNAPISIGFIAQDFAAVFPDLIRKRKNDDGVKPIKKPKPPRPPEVPTVPGSGTAQPETPTTPPASGGTTPTTPAPANSGGPRTLASLFTDDPIAPVGASAPAAAESEMKAAASDEPDESDSISVIEQQGFQITSYEELIPMLVGAVKELAQINLDLRAKVEDLEKKVKKLSPTI